MKISSILIVVSLIPTRGFAAPPEIQAPAPASAKTKPAKARPRSTRRRARPIRGMDPIKRSFGQSSSSPVLAHFYDGQRLRGGNTGAVWAASYAARRRANSGLKPARPAVRDPLRLPAALERQIAGIRWTPEKTRALIARMPKYEMHLHLDGSLSPETIQKLARRQNYAPLKDKSLTEIERLAVVKDYRGSLKGVLDSFNTFYPLLRNKEAMEQISYDLARAAKSQNMRYMEVRFAPALQATPSFPVDQVVESVLKGLKRGEKDFGVKSGAIICLYRPLAQEHNEAMFQAALKYSKRGVVGIDLAGDEAAFPLANFKDFFVRAKEKGLHTTVHAGETPGSKDLELALELGVERISHATLLAEKPDLLAKVIERKMPIEVNLTSNLRTGAAQDYKTHPALDWYRKGVPISINTDDPGVFGISLTHEYRALNEKMGLKPADLAAIEWRTINGLFLPLAEKDRLRAEFQSEMSRLLSGLR